MKEIDRSRTSDVLCRGVNLPGGIQLFEKKLLPVVEFLGWLQRLGKLSVREFRLVLKNGIGVVALVGKGISLKVRVQNRAGKLIGGNKSRKSLLTAFQNEKRYFGYFPRVKIGNRTVEPTDEIPLHVV